MNRIIVGVLALACLLLVSPVSSQNKKIPGINLPRFNLVTDAPPQAAPVEVPKTKKTKTEFIRLMECPVVDTESLTCKRTRNECMDDEDCNDDEKCCKISCGRKCLNLQFKLQNNKLTNDMEEDLSNSMSTNAIQQQMLAQMMMGNPFQQQSQMLNMGTMNPMSSLGLGAYGALSGLGGMNHLSSLGGLSGLGSYGYGSGINPMSMSFGGSANGHSNQGINLYKAMKNTGHGRNFLGANMLQQSPLNSLGAGTANGRGFLNFY